MRLFVTLIFLSIFCKSFDWVSKDAMAQGQGVRVKGDLGRELACARAHDGRTEDAAVAHQVAHLDEA